MTSVSEAVYPGFLFADNFLTGELEPQQHDLVPRKSDELCLCINSR